MPASALNNLGLKAGWTLAEGGWGDDMNANLRALDAMAQATVIDKDLSEPPAFPAAGAVYVVGASPTGAWAGKTGNLARYSGSAWEFYAPKAGWNVFVQDEGVPYRYQGTGWITEAALLGANVLDIGAGYEDKPTASLKIIPDIPMARAVSFAASFAGSVAKATVAATASAVFSIQKNGAQVGTVTFAAGGSTGVYAGSAVAFAAGDRLGIVAPATPDATLAGVGFVLSGTR